MLKDSALAWHKRYGHISIKAIKKLEDIIEGVIITIAKLYSKNKDNLQEECEIYAMNNNNKQISRVPMPKLNQAFHTLFVDIIVITQAITGEQYVLHAICPIAKFHALAAIDSKAVILNIKAMIEQIKHIFKIYIKVIHTDR